MDRTILHCDLNGFYASVECLFRPELKEVPMAVGGNEETRHGIILAKNELAKQYHIQTAETVWSAKRKCPDLVIVPPRHGEYAKYSKIVNGIYREYTDLVEPFGIDESWLDVTASRRLFGDGKTIADTIRERVKNEVGLTVSVGVSFNKVFAKLGSDYKKPDATTVILREDVEKIVYPLPASALLFVGKSTLDRLKSLRIETIGDLANAEEMMLEKKLGKAGKMLHRYALGEDDAPVSSIYETEEVKSVGNGMTFRRDLVGAEDVQKGIHILSDSVAMRLRKKGLLCETVQITVKSPEFQTASRQKKLDNATHLEKDISRVAYRLFTEIWEPDRPVRAITITATGLVPKDNALVQLSLFEDPAANPKRERLEETMDRLRDKFGYESLTTGGLLKYDLYDTNRKDKNK